MALSLESFSYFEIGFVKLLGLFLFLSLDSFYVNVYVTDKKKKNDKPTNTTNSV